MDKIKTIFKAEYDPESKQIIIIVTPCPQPLLCQALILLDIEAKVKIAEQNLKEELKNAPNIIIPDIPSGMKH